jgi:hypothetical protein
MNAEPPPFDEASAPKNSKLSYTRDRINVLIDVINHTQDGNVDARSKMKNEDGYKTEVDNLHHKFYPWTFPMNDSETQTLLL